MCKVRRSIIHLQPPHHAMVRQILGNTIIGNAKVLGQLWLNGVSAAFRTATPHEIGNGHTQGLARLHVVVRRQIGVRQQPHAGARGGVARVLKLRGRAGEQSAEIHLQLRQTRRQPGVPRPPAKAWHAHFGGFLGRCPTGALWSGGCFRFDSHHGQRMPRPCVARITLPTAVLAAPRRPVRFVATAAAAPVPLVASPVGRLAFRLPFLLRLGRRGLLGLHFLRFRLPCRQAFARRRRFRRLWLERRNLRRFGRPKPGGAFLRLRFPIRTPEALGCGQVPPPSIIRFAGGFQIAGQFKSHHGVARLREQIRQLSCGVFSGACSADSCGDLLPVGHTVQAF